MEGGGGRGGKDGGEGDVFKKRNKKWGSERKTEATVMRKKMKERKMSGKGGERVMKE